VRRSWGAAACCITLLASCAALAGCSSGQQSPGQGSGAGTVCGTTHTAVGVPVIIKVAKGSVACSAALGVESRYTAVIKAGDVRGTGGGAPVTVSGWVCQGYSTTEVLTTGDASQCHSGGTEILAVLPVPTAKPSS
jgi:hypothetical protein